MTRHATLPILLAALALAGCGDPYAGNQPRLSSSENTTATAPPPPKLTAAQINQQDRVDRAHKHREEHAMRSRPLLDHLPLTVGDAEISIYGLAADNRHTVLLIEAPTKTLGREAYRYALHAYADRGTAYQPKYQLR